MCFDAPRRMSVRDAAKLFLTKRTSEKVTHPTSLFVKRGFFCIGHTPEDTVTAGANSLNFMTQNNSKLAVSGWRLAVSCQLIASIASRIMS